MDTVVGALSSKNPEAPSYMLKVLFDVKGKLDTPQLELASAKWVSDQSGPNISENDIEEQLNKTYHKLATALPSRDREKSQTGAIKMALHTRSHHCC
jgi:hypothetical protein